MISGRTNRCDKVDRQLAVPSDFIIGMLAKDAIDSLASDAWEGSNSQV